MKFTIRKLTEADEANKPKETKEYMTKRELKLKKQLINLLRDDGQGHRHAKFAERLEDFDIKIVPIAADPEMTAAIDFDTATIYISEGFLTNPATFFQLNVLMRHELAHYLLMHQARMTHKLFDNYGDEASKHLLASKSLHELINIIEDFEISNTRYSIEDKKLVRQMVLNGHIIGGLVTEDHRNTWKDMTVTDMYDALAKELDNLHSSILSYWKQAKTVSSKLGDDYTYNSRDLINRNLKNELYKHVLIEGPTNFFGSLADYIQNKALYHFIPFDRGTRPCIVKYSNLPEAYQKIIVELNNTFLANALTTYKKQELRDIITEIKKTNPIASFDLKDPQLGNIIITLYSPEEKFVAIDALKAIIPFLEPYQTWYDKVKKVLGDSKYSDADRQKVLSEISK